jgi:integration host factor subunit beta
MKSEIVEKILAENPSLSKFDVNKVVEIVFDQISNALSTGKRVEIRGFGAFSVKHKPARTGRNPRTGEPVDIPAKTVPHFKAGKDLRDMLNDMRKAA